MSIHITAIYLHFYYAECTRYNIIFYKWEINKDIYESILREKNIILINFFSAHFSYFQINEINLTCPQKGAEYVQCTVWLDHKT